jgi:hypothetical protein
MSQPKQIKFYRKVKSKKGKWIQESFYDSSENFPTQESIDNFMKKYGFFKYQLI